LVNSNFPRASRMQGGGLPVVAAEDGQRIYSKIQNGGA